MVRFLEVLRGTVRFVGSTDFATGPWLGVELDLKAALGVLDVGHRAACEVLARESPRCLR